MEHTSLDLLLAHLASLGISIPEETPSKLLLFLDKVLEANKTMNLTSITDPSLAVQKHLVDSLAVLMLESLAAQISQAPHWTDVGTGAGFPGVALAIAVPSATVHLIESTGKKAHFLNILAAELGLRSRIHVYAQRAEALASALPAVTMGSVVPRGTEVSLRNRSDAVFFRGVSKLAGLVELGAPLLKLQGLLVAYKGPKASEELTEARQAMKELKMELIERKDFILPGVQEARCLLVLKKVGETPKRFPRLIGMAQKEPII